MKERRIRTLTTKIEKLTQAVREALAIEDYAKAKELNAKLITAKVRYNSL